MNRSLVFKNVKGYDLFLITPNGAGRRLPNGKCVSGSFYIQTAKSGHLVRVPEHLVVEDDVLWTAESSGYKAPKPEPEVVPVVPVLVPETPQETAPVVSVAEADPVVEAAPFVPTPVVDPIPPVVEAVISPAERDLIRLGMEELKMIAATRGIDFPHDIKKKKLIALINSAR